MKYSSDIWIFWNVLTFQPIAFPLSQARAVLHSIGGGGKSGATVSRLSFHFTTVTARHLSV